MIYSHYKVRAWADIQTAILFPRWHDNYINKLETKTKEKIMTYLEMFS
jgi:hypothetical protein